MSEPSHSSIPEEDKEQLRPLSFGDDVLRSLKGEPAPLGPDGKPLIQPWAVGPGRVLGLTAAIIGLIGSVFSGLFGIALGLCGFIFSNTAWAHLRNAKRPRRLPLAGQIIGAIAVLSGALTMIIPLVLGA